MRSLKFALGGMAAIFLLSVFALPYYSVGEHSITLWSLAGKEGSGGAKTALYMCLLGTIGLTMLSGLSIKFGRMSRLFAGLSIVAAIIIIVGALKGFSGNAPVLKVGGLGAKALLFGGVLCLIASLIGVIKAERNPAAVLQN